MARIIQVGGYADRKIITRFNIGELDNLDFMALASKTDGSIIQVAETTDWAYFRDNKSERVCKVRRDEVTAEEDQDTFNAVFDYFK